MPDPLENLSFHQRLMAYADGELDASRQIDVMRRIAVDPQAARFVEHELQLRQAMVRAVASEPGPSDALVKAVSSLAFQLPADDQANGPVVADAGYRIRGGWQLAGGLAASVAILTVGMLIGRFALPPSAPIAAIPSADTTGAGDVIPVQYASTATQMHVRCSHSAGNHGSKGWPASLSSIETPFKRYIGGEQQYPDFSSIGFRYVGCAPCGMPEQRSAHLLYRSDNGVDTLSLFVEPFKNQVHLQPGECCYCKRSDIHPLLAWRNNDLLFVLVGNAMTPVENARIAMNVPVTY